MASRLFGGGLLGFAAYGVQYLRAAGVLFFVASASYMLALLFDSALAGSTFGLYWLLILSGKAFWRNTIFRLTHRICRLCRNRACAAVRDTGALSPFEARRSPACAVGACGRALFITFAAWQFWSVIRDGHDPEIHLSPVMERMADQDTALGRPRRGITFCGPTRQAHRSNSI